MTKQADLRDLGQSIEMLTREARASLSTLEQSGLAHTPTYMALQWLVPQTEPVLARATAGDLSLLDDETCDAICSSVLVVMQFSEVMMAEIHESLAELENAQPRTIQPSRRSRRKPTARTEKTS